MLNSCNGSKPFKKENIIAATILTGPDVGQLSYIPRIRLIEAGFPKPFRASSVKISFTLLLSPSAEGISPLAVGTCYFDTSTTESVKIYRLYGKVAEIL